MEKILEKINLEEEKVEKLINFLNNFLKEG